MKGAVYAYANMCNNNHLVCKIHVHTRQLIDFCVKYIYMYIPGS